LLSLLSIVECEVNQGRNQVTYSAASHQRGAVRALSTSHRTVDASCLAWHDYRSAGSLSGDQPTSVATSLSAPTALYDPSHTMNWNIYCYFLWKI